jgi:HSP20 family protein
MNRLFRDFFEEDFPVATAGWDPAVDVAETPETVVVKAELPGINPKDVEISFSGNTLNLKGSRHEEKEEKGKTWHRIERRYGSFARSIPFDVPVHGDKAEAEYKDGVLTVTVPKRQEALTKRIEVKSRL